ncbi:MAG: PIN domain-containing protein [Chloroflexi bacterium]|nr:PIN domain-containing protein [Chloroflexota bacterium]
MPRVYADTPFYIARLNPDDSLHRAAVEAFHSLDPATSLKTSAAVLMEVLEYFAYGGDAWREAATFVVEGVIRRRDMDLVDIDRRLFLDAFELYRARRDYSLTECLSIVICRKSRIDTVLTHNPHFRDEGFAILF